MCIFARLILAVFSGRSAGSAVRAASACFMVRGCNTGCHLTAVTRAAPNPSMAGKIREGTVNGDVYFCTSYPRGFLGAKRGVCGQGCVGMFHGSWLQHGVSSHSSNAGCTKPVYGRENQGGDGERGCVFLHVLSSRFSRGEARGLRSGLRRHVSWFVVATRGVISQQ